MDHLILFRKPDLVAIKKRKKEKKNKTYHIVDFAILKDYAVKIKESEQTDLDLTRELKKGEN